MSTNNLFESLGSRTDSSGSRRSRSLMRDIQHSPLTECSTGSSTESSTENLNGSLTESSTESLTESSTETDLEDDEITETYDEHQQEVRYYQAGETDIYNKNLVHPRKCTVYYVDGLIHRFRDSPNEPHLPAIVCDDKSMYWFEYSRQHRENDLPATIEYNRVEDGSVVELRKWFIHDKLHRDNDLPAMITSNGIEGWYRHGVIYRSTVLTDQQVGALQNYIQYGYVIDNSVFMIKHSDNITPKIYECRDKPLTSKSMGFIFGVGVISAITVIGICIKYVTVCPFLQKWN